MVWTEGLQNREPRALGGDDPLRGEFLPSPASQRVEHSGQSTEFRVANNLFEFEWQWRYGFRNARPFEQHLRLFSVFKRGIPQ